MKKKKDNKPYYTREFVLFSIILNDTIPGIILSETVLSWGNPLYYATFSAVVYNIKKTIAHENMNKIPSKNAHNRRIFFSFSNANRPKTSPDFHKDCDFYIMTLHVI